MAESAALAAYTRHSPDGDRTDDVAGGLLALVTEVRRFADWAGSRVEALTAGDWQPDDPRAQAELALYERTLDRSHRLLADVARLKLEAQLVRITTLQVAALNRIVGGALRDCGYDPQQERLRAAIAARARLERGHG